MIYGKAANVQVGETYVIISSIYNIGIYEISCHAGSVMSFNCYSSAKFSAGWNLFIRAAPVDGSFKPELNDLLGEIRKPTTPLGARKPERKM